MRVLLLRSSRGFFGAERVILDLAARLATHEVDACVACLDDARERHLELVERASRVGLETWTVPVDGRIPLRATVQVARSLRDGGFDVLHVHDYKTLAIGIIAARVARCALVATLHGETGHTGAVRIYERAARQTWRGVDRLAAVSRPLYEQAVAKVGAERVVYVPNGVDVGALRAAAQGVDVVEPGEIVGVGRLTREKGHDVLIEAVAMMAAPRPKLVIVGDGPEEGRLRALATDRRVDLELPGFVQDVAPVLARASVFCLPSRTEGLPLALLEALAVGVAAVATDVGDVRRVLRDGAGVVVPSESPEPLARALASLLDDPVRRAEQVKCGTRRADEYDVDLLATRYARDVYAPALDRVRPR